MYNMHDKRRVFIFTRYLFRESYMDFVLCVFSSVEIKYKPELISLMSGYTQADPVVMNIFFLQAKF